MTGRGTSPAGARSKRAPMSEVVRKSRGPFDVLIAEHALLVRRLEAIDREATREGDGFERTVRAFRESFVRHQRREDRVLYPVCEHLFGGPHGAASVLRDEHATLRKDLDALAKGPDGGVRRETLARIVRRFRDPVSREERILFPLTAALLSGTDMSSLGRRLRDAAP